MLPIVLLKIIKLVLLIKVNFAILQAAKLGVISKIIRVYVFQMIVEILASNKDQDYILLMMVT
jgi:hypothetical protein